MVNNKLLRCCRVLAATLTITACTTMRTTYFNVGHVELAKANDPADRLERAEYRQHHQGLDGISAGTGPAARDRVAAPADRITAVPEAAAVRPDQQAGKHKIRNQQAREARNYVESMRRTWNSPEFPQQMERQQQLDIRFNNAPNIDGQLFTFPMPRPMQTSQDQTGQSAIVADTRGITP